MSFISAVLLHLASLFGLTFGAREMYNIAHMTNTPGTVNWALGRGANGVEIDLTFDTSTGTPLVFRHSVAGEACDCTCLCPAPLWSLCETLYPNSVCAKLLNDVSGISPCRAESSVSSLLSTIAGKKSLALVVVDSKIQRDDMDDAKMKTAGVAVVNVLKTYLFDGGFGGKVIIGSPKLDTLPYLKSAADTVNRTPYKDRVYFTIDLETNNIVETLRKLHTLPTKNIVYGTGISACSPQQIKTCTMQLAAVNTAQGVSGLTYLWTVDKDSTILANLPYVQAVMTNYPGKVYDIFQRQGIKLATQSSVIPAASSSNVITTFSDCDCNYHPGGCRISKSALQGLACMCVYKDFWTCGGNTVQCSDTESKYCKQPDNSVHSCLLGGGDCEGYKTATCDCDYHPGGCSISKAPPPNTACKCIYKGAWTCGGEITRCIDEQSAFCKTPDRSIHTCLLGGGDCEGYKTATCDCDYHPGGCSISRASPPNTACKCIYKGAWTCGGEVVRCLDFQSNYCKSPDKSVQACFQGQGDCEGYRTASCDCDYSRGGCKISKVPPPNTACRCVYKGFWTCGGRIDRCRDFNNYYCKHPDSSKNTCQIGGGDCGGYR